MSNTPVYHGVLIAEGCKNPSFLNSFKVFAKRKSESENWTLCGIIVEELKLDQSIRSIQNQLRADEPWYAHLYNDEELIVIFKKKVFRVTPHRSTWNKIIKYGRTLGILDDQLDFWPNRFQDEIHYFAPSDFIP